MKKQKNIDLTQGNIVKQIILFALPLLGSSLVQLLYNTADLLFIGQFLGKNESAAVGASTMMVTCLVGLFGGLSVGATVAVAIAFGAKDGDKVKRILQTSAALSIISGIIVFLAGYSFAPAFIHVIGTPREIADSAVGYLRIYFFSSIFIVSYNMGAGVMRGMGESFVPLLFQIVGGVTNVVMDAVFLRGLNMGINGVAWATFFSQGAAAVCTVIYLFSHISEEYRIHLRSITIQGDILLSILRVGIPSGLQTLVIALSNVVAQYFINSLGTNAIAAFTAYFKVELPIYLPIVALGQATTTFVGQNLGAGNPQRARRGTGICLKIGCMLTIITSFLLIIGGDYAFGLFVRDAAVVALGNRIIRTTFPFYWQYVFLQVFGDSIKGAGKALPPTVIIMINITIIRSIILISLVPIRPDVRTIAVSYPVTWFLTAAQMVIYYMLSNRKKEKSCE